MAARPAWASACSHGPCSAPRACRSGRGRLPGWCLPACRWSAPSRHCLKKPTTNASATWWPHRALRAKRVGAALYPAIVTIVAIVIVLFLVGYVVPQVASVFAGTKRALPFLTVAMLGISAFVRSYGWMMLIASVLIAFGTRWALTIGHVREKFDAAWLNLPLVGKLARGYNAARFAGTLAMLAGAGVPILKALQAAAETLNNRALRADALEALVLVREGAPLASALAQKKRFPGLLSMFARLGEQTGQ